MLTRVWGAISAAIGGLILVLLVVYGIEYGTWIDEVGPLPIAPPTVVLPLIIGVLAGMLLLGGIVVAIVGPAQHETSPAASRSDAGAAR